MRARDETQLVTGLRVLYDGIATVIGIEPDQLTCLIELRQRDEPVARRRDDHAVVGVGDELGLENIHLMIGVNLGKWRFLRRKWRVNT